MNFNTRLNIQDILSRMDEGSIIHIKAFLQKNYLNASIVLKDGSSQKMQFGIIIKDKNVHKIAIKMIDQNISTIEKIGREVEIIFNDGSKIYYNPGIISAQDLV